MLGLAMARFLAGPEGVQEIKTDGYRAKAHVHQSQVHVHQSKITVFSRSGYDWTEEFAPIGMTLRGDGAERHERKVQRGRGDVKKDRHHRRTRNVMCTRVQLRWDQYVGPQSRLLHN